jgi:hypothetical protein
MAEVSDAVDAGSNLGQKRKRASESGSPDSRRSKRGVPTASMTVSDSDTAFLENTVSIAQAAQDHVNVDDFSALAQATAEHNDTDTATASSTAAAALNMYPTLHVPAPTEETFAAQTASDQHHDGNSFNASVADIDGLPVVSPTMQSANGLQEKRYSTSSTPKPAVGSEEWHKMRKDNHKEGKGGPALREPTQLS